jgi:hypothetical protein
VTLRTVEHGTRPGVEDAVRRKLEAARARHKELEHRRHTLERELETVRAAEQESRQALDDLIEVAHLTGAADSAGAGVEPEGGAHESGGVAGTHMLAGGELRETLTRIALRRNAHGRPVHWREWFGWLRDAGYDAAGKRAEATFQTQLARSPLVRRTEREGVYLLDVQLLARRRDELLELHERLEQLPGPDQLTLIGGARDARRRLLQEIGRAERRLEEAWRTLTEELGPEWSSERDAGADDVARLWLRRQGHDSPELPAPLL